MSMDRNTYPIEIAGVFRELPLFEVQPGLRIAVLNILGDTELVEACANRDTTPVRVAIVGTRVIPTVVVPDYS